MTFNSVHAMLERVYSNKTLRTVLWLLPLLAVGGVVFVVNDHVSVVLSYALGVVTALGLAVLFWSSVEKKLIDDAAARRDVAINHLEQARKVLEDTRANSLRVGEILKEAEARAIIVDKMHVDAIRILDEARECREKCRNG